MPPTYSFLANNATQDAHEVFSLSTSHLAALQHFPRAFKWLDGRNVARTNQCVGNAVLPPVARILARAISQTMRHIPTNQRTMPTKAA